MGLVETLTSIWRRSMLPFANGRIAKISISSLPSLTPRIVKYPRRFSHSSTTTSANNDIGVCSTMHGNFRTRHATASRYLDILYTCLYISPAVLYSGYYRVPEHLVVRPI